jgi:hypothetical protein
MILAVTSLLSILLLTLHITDDIVRGISKARDHFFLATDLLKNVPRRSMPLEATVPTANCRVDEHDCLFTTVDCGLSIST